MIARNEDEFELYMVREANIFRVEVKTNSLKRLTKDCYICLQKLKLIIMYQPLFLFQFLTDYFKYLKSHIYRQ